MANVSGIQGFNRGHIEPFDSIDSFEGGKSVAVNTGAAKQGVLSGELQTIQALANAAPQQGQGVGSSIGGLLGAGAGALGGPVGAAVGGTVGQSIGSLVDFGLNKSENDKKKRRDLEARRKQISKEKRIANTNASIANKTRLRGIATERDQALQTEESVLAAQRDNLLNNITSDINKRAQFSDLLKSKFIQSRSVV